MRHLSDGLTNARFVLIALIAVGWSLVDSATLGFGQTAPGFTYQEVTAARGIRFGLNRTAALPGLFPTEQARYGAGCATSDYDRDGDLDLYFVAHGGHANRLLRNDGGNFTDVTATAGVGDLGWGHMALFLDLDDDGFDDLLVFNDAVPSVLVSSVNIYENRGDGTFGLRTGTGVDPICPIIGGATAGDYDRDGDLDLYVTSWYDNANYLYRNDDDFLFTEVTTGAGLRISETFVSHWTPVFADFDGDRWPDLFCAVDFNEDYLFLNQQDGTFALRPTASSLQNDMGVAVGDFDEDGDLDLYTTNITDSAVDPAGCCNWLYVNDGAGNFTNGALAAGVGDTAWGWGTAFFDADLDGDLDLMAVNGWHQPWWVSPAALFVQEPSGAFDEVASVVGVDHVGNSHALTPLDYDGDGDIDVVIVDAFGRAHLYENDVTTGAHWLRVRLEGRASNRNGVGARVEVELRGGRTLMREIVAGSSTYAGPPLEAHFGLGDNDVVDLEVTWPSGFVQRQLGVSVDTVLVVTEDGP